MTIVRWKSDVGVQRAGHGSSNTHEGGLPEDPCFEGMCIVLEMGCDSLLIPFGTGFLSCDYFLTFSFCRYKQRLFSLESQAGLVPPFLGPLKKV